MGINKIGVAFVVIWACIFLTQAGLYYNVASNIMLGL